MILKAPYTISRGAGSRDEEVKSRFEDVKARFDDLDKRISTTDKRFDDVKYFAGGVSILLSVLALIASYNFTNERTSIRESLKELKEEVGKIEATPNLELFGLNGQSLSGQEISGQEIASKERDGRILNFSFFLRNVGSGATGPMWVKVYSSELHLENKSSDDANFKYETIIEPEGLKPSELPGNISTQRYVNVWLAERPKPGKYAVQMKHYYGKGKILTAKFTVVIS